jgi:cysteine protease ATG4
MENNENKINIEENKKESKEQIALNNKKKIIFLNSFSTEPISEKQKEEKEENKENKEKDIITSDGDEIQKEQIPPTKFDSILNYKNEFNLNKYLKKFHLFYYQCKNPSEDKIAYRFGKILLFTYGKNFPKINSYKNKKTYTSDSGWGCMLRCGQMILSRGIYRFLKSKKMDTKDALYYTFSLFFNHPIKEENLHKYFHGMINKYNLLKKEGEGEGEENNKKIKDFFPPFSIKTICQFAEFNGKTAGEWFSDVNMSYIFKNISEYFELFNNSELNAKILNFQSCIEIQDILTACFIEKNKLEKGNNKYIKLKGKIYYFDKMGIIFVNVRIGLDKIPKDYYQGIKELFNLKECIGIIGGKERNAFYFIGYSETEDSLLYLDPHVTKEDDKTINIKDILSKHVLKPVHLLKMSKMSTGFTIGFCFRTYEEFLHLFEFWLKAKQSKLPILGLVKQPIVVEIKHKDLESDDF